MVRDNDGVLFEGLIFDGNAQGNDYFVSWARHTSLWLTAAGSEVQHSTFVHSQGDAITVQGENNLIKYNQFDQLNGSAVHFSDASDPVVANNQITNTGQEAERVQHVEAAITWSTSNQNVLIENNCIQDIPVAAFGKIYVHGSNLGTTISSNRICRTDALLLASTIENTPSNILFTNNHA